MKKWDLILWLAAMALALSAAFAANRARALPTGSWGLSFGEPGAAPRGNADPAHLEKYGAAFLGDPSRKTLYLTFDAGYENGVTSQILDTLKEKQVPAAFFLVGNFIEKNADLVRRMVEEGHTVGNHTMHHYDMSRISDRETFTRELRDLEDCFRKATGRELAPYYRPPQGIYSPENLRMAKDLGYHTVFWSLAYVDWNNDSQPTREEALRKLLPRTHNGAVILLHATSHTNARILGELIDRWKAEGYCFAPISQLFGA